MYIGQQLTSAVLLTIALVGSGASAAVFTITAYTSSGTQIDASDLKIREVYTNATGVATDNTTNPAAYPINRTINASATAPSVTFTITQKSTGKTTSLTLHGNRPATGAVLLNPVLP